MLMGYSTMITIADMAHAPLCGIVEPAERVAWSDAPRNRAGLVFVTLDKRRAIHVITQRWHVVLSAGLRS